MTGTDKQQRRPGAFEELFEDYLREALSSTGIFVYIGSSKAGAFQLNSTNHGPAKAGAYQPTQQGGSQCKGLAGKLWFRY